MGVVFELGDDAGVISKSAVGATTGEGVISGVSLIGDPSVSEELWPLDAMIAEFSVHADMLKNKNRISARRYVLLIY